MSSFKAYRIHQEGKGVRAGFETMDIGELSAGDVVVQVAYSCINYKDALAATGQGRILRQYPLNGGIDMAGRVVSSQTDQFTPGDAVLCCGMGMSETRDGGYAEYVRLNAEHLQKLPQGLSLRDAMAIGTAGFTAAIAVQRMEDNGQIPSNGPIVVTGATGGVGSFAISMFAGLGYEVLAYTGKMQQREYLLSLGASDLIDRHSVDFGSRPLESARWGGAVDNLGGETLNWLTRTVKPWGNIASIGLAAGIELNTTVMPLILRGVSLLGINCLELPDSMRQRCWARLGDDLRAPLDLIAPRTITFDELPQAFDDFISARHSARTVVAINPD
ncbi:MAG: YhdH/YhfP family quinone oxidoreductase [Gammaproteobacteria bacterium]|nr:YhdH/YhfP family quinone oxidoreductase [Gammaproteobacteria bacterium]